jgi:hypothetical protein
MKLAILVHHFKNPKRNGDGSKPWYLVNPKIAGKWMFIPLKMVLIGIDPYPDLLIWCNQIKHDI